MGRSRVLSVIAGTGDVVLARGEIWVAPAVLEGQGLPNNAAGVVELAARLGADLCFLSCRGPQAVPNQAEVLREAVSLVHIRDLACGAVVDGPWQRLAERDGLIQLMARLGGRLGETEQEVALQATVAGEELRAWCEAGVDLVLLTDDIAYNRGLYFSPRLFTRLLLPHYRELLLTAGERRVPTGFHSDGDLTLLLPALIDAGFSFFSLEPEAMDPSEVRHRYDDRFVLIGGIRAEWLSDAGGSGVGHTDLRREISSLVSTGRTILASSCGLYEPSSVAFLKRVYRAADGLPQSGG